MPTLNLRYQAVRHLDDTAIPFILNSWLKSYRWSDQSEDYYREHAPKVKRLLKSNRILIASLTEETDCYVGWACGKSGLLHYVYVKSVFRRDGIAKTLIEKVCGPIGVYTSKSRNQSFLRYLDEKGFTYDEEKQRDTSNLAKEPSAGARDEKRDEGPVGAVQRPPANLGTGRSIGDVREVT